MDSSSRCTSRGYRLALVALLAASGCQGNNSVPSPDGLVLGEGDGTIVVYRWKNGPAVVIVGNVFGSSSNTGSFSGPPPVCKAEGFVSAKDGRRFDWLLETTDGKNVKCHIDGKEYDLAKGALFFVKTTGGKTEVEQIIRDISAVQPNTESCKDFAKNSTDVAKLLGKPEK